MPWRLLVVDGADADRFFPLPDSGSVIIGNSHKHADICLHDLLVARIHCQVDNEDGVVSVTALSDDKETRVNGEKVAMKILEPGAVLRVGNSHLRLEEDAGRDKEDDEVLEADGIVDPDEVVEAEEVVEVLDPDNVAEVVEAADPAESDPEPEPVPRLGWKDLEQLSGHTLGHFEIGPVLGRGITAVTFRARDREAHREVALKVIGPDFPATTAELQQFARTIRKVAAIQEEHLVRWYAAGKTSRYVWISQELIEGESLTHVLERGQSASMMLKWRNALKLGIDLAKALKCLFERKIIHGNVTPPNVIIDLDRTARLNDVLYEEALRDSKWAADRLEKKLLAQLPYLAPERLEEGAYWDGLADIYSLGALVYARLTGQPPYHGCKPGQLITAVREGRLAKPRELVSACPEPFQAAILKMMAHNQEERYQTPAQLLLELEGLQTII